MFGYRDAGVELSKYTDRDRRIKKCERNNQKANKLQKVKSPMKLSKKNENGEIVNKK